MIREEVIKVWTGLKEMIKKERDICEFITYKMCGGGVIPDFSFLNSEKVWERIGEWSESQYQDRVDKEKSKVMIKADETKGGEENLILAYFNFANMFKKLVEIAKLQRDFKEAAKKRTENILSKLKKEVNWPKEGSLSSIKVSWENLKMMINSYGEYF